MNNHNYSFANDIFFDEIQRALKAIDSDINDADISALVYRFVSIYNLFYRPQSSFSNLYNSAKDFLSIFFRLNKIGIKQAISEFIDIQKIRYKSSFDHGFYQLQLAANKNNYKIDTCRHYVIEGYKNGFDPNIGFNSDFYISGNQDVVEAKKNPYIHYLTSGFQEGRRIEPSYKITEIAQSIVNKWNSNEGYAISDLLNLQTTFGLTGHNSINSFEDITSKDWKLRDDPLARINEFGLYDIRPHDQVIIEAQTSKNFLSRHNLDGENPDYKSALLEINNLDPIGFGKPIVTIIIPIYGQLNYTINCLHALSLHKSKYSFEIIIADDCSPDNSFELLSKISNLKIVKTEKNVGFIRNCNNASKFANGEFIVFLNNDTFVCENWLDKLIDSFSLFENVGLVGSKLFYPDGSLQEAGGIIWQDGSAWNYGRNDDPNRPRYCYAREVDYISGASIAIRKAIWDQLNGFSEDYCPAYYEDADLAMRIKQIGLKTIFQPLSNVIHYEGKTSGTDLNSGIKLYQSKNQQIFYDKWKSNIENHRKNGDKPWLERDRNKQKRVLIIDACNPSPWTDAGSLATWNLIKQYKSLGYHVIFVPEDNFLYQEKQVKNLQEIGIECHYAPYSTSMTNILKSFDGILDIIHLIRADVAKKNLKLIQSFAKNTKIFFLNADFHFLRLERQAALENDSELAEIAKKMKNKEIEIVKNVDVTFVHSTVEKQLIETILPKSKIQYLPLIEEVVGANAPAQSRLDVMFLGGYGHPPNVDAAVWLIKEIWPKLKPKLHKNAKLLIVGSNPPQHLKNLNNEDVIITGLVPNLMPWFERTKVFIAPLRYGAGAKGKLLASMSHGVPVVATSIAAEGMPFKEGENILIADEIDKIVEMVCKIYNLSADEWKNFSNQSVNNISQNHNFEYGKDCLLNGVILGSQPK